jgi:hypothetical protein
VEGPFQERDWKYLKSIHDEMLFALCEKINREAVEIVQSKTESEHAKYRKLFRHIHDSDDIIAECFDDWRRSTIARRAFGLYRHRLLTADHLAHLTPKAQESIKALETIWK